MFWRKKKHVCAHWDCNRVIPEDELLCPEHYSKWVEGLIDKCPKCGRLKDVMYYMCLDCYVGRKIKNKKPVVDLPKPKKAYRIEYTDNWSDAYLERGKCYIYILELDDGVLYIGHTTDIYSRLAEVRQGKKSPGARQAPRLHYLEIAINENAAETRVLELKRLVQSNPGQIEAMSTEFHHHMREFGLEIAPKAKELEL
jgi:predicted GIY-YIG superfamily endonuclease